MKAELSLTPELADLIAQCQSAAVRANDALSLVLTAAVRSHGHKAAQFVALNGSTLTVELPDNGERD